MDAESVASWESCFEDLFDQVGKIFGRADLRFQARGYGRGLLASMDRKNSW